MTYLEQMRDNEVVTTHHLATLAHKNVRDAEFILECMGVPIDPHLRTVTIGDLRAAGLVAPYKS